MMTSLGFMSDCYGREERAVMRGETKREEEEDDADVDTLHLHWFCSAIALMLM